MTILRNLFELKELLFRVNALLRRSQTPNETVIQIGQLKIDSQNYLVTLGKKELYLPLKEFEVLHKLAFIPKNITRDQLIDSIWDSIMKVMTELLMFILSV